MIKELRSFKLNGYGDLERWFWVWVLPYDILEKRNEYIADFICWFSLTFGSKIWERFERKIDYNSKYGLKSDAVLPFDEFLKKDETFRSFVKLDRSGIKHEITVEDLQKSVSDIQLVPNVPEGVMRVFNAAKRLYIFGYFYYYFFTISKHYAFLALESALRNRNSEIFGKPKNFKSLNMIIEELVRNGTITQAEAKIYDSGRYIRNCL